MLTDGRTVEGRLKVDGTYDGTFIILTGKNLENKHYITTIRVQSSTI